MKRQLATIAVLAILAIAASTHPQRNDVLNSSLIELIANPDKHDGKVVLVTGYLRLEHEGDIIYLSENDYLHGIPKNGLWVERTAELIRNMEKIDSSYVLLVGTFNSRLKGHRSATSGGIEKVRSCTLWSKPNEPISGRLR